MIGTRDPRSGRRETAEHRPASGRTSPSGRASRRGSVCWAIHDSSSAAGGATSGGAGGVSSRIAPRVTGRCSQGGEQERGARARPTAANAEARRASFVTAARQNSRPSCRLGTSREARQARGAAPRPHVSPPTTRWRADRCRDCGTGRLVPGHGVAVVTVLGLVLEAPAPCDSRRSGRSRSARDAPRAEWRSRPGPGQAAMSARRLEADGRPWWQTPGSGLARIRTIAQQAARARVAPVRIAVRRQHTALLELSPDSLAVA
jgi:hypothetical protein